VIFRVVVLAAVLCCAVSACDSDPSTLPPPTATHNHTVTAGPPTATAYTLDLLDGAKVVQVHSAPLHGHLYEITTPSGTDVVPLVHQDGAAVAVTLTGGADADLSITVEQSVHWSLKFSSGVSTLSVDMRSGTLSGFTALQGVSTVDITAGAPQGRVVLRELAGVSVFALHVPGTTPVSVKAYAGAGTVSLFGESQSGVSAGTTVTSPYVGPSRYRIEAVGGVSTVNVDAAR
jgi:hypothetical protein